MRSYSMNIVHVVLQTVQEPVTIIPPCGSENYLQQIEVIKLPASSRSSLERTLATISPMTPRTHCSVRTH